MSIKNFSYHAVHYFSKRVSRQLEELYASVAIMDFAVSAISIFEPIYLWKIGYNLQQILLFYLAVYVLYVFLIPLGGKSVGSIGYERSILYSCFFLIFYYLCLFLIPHHPVFLVLAVFMFAMQKSLYWPAYHGDFAEYSQKEDRGRETAGIVNISMIVCVLGPLAGGFIIKFFGFNVLFFVVSLLILISNIPMMVTKEIFKKEAFPYFSTFKMIFSKENRRSFFAYLGFGEELIVMVVWPVFIYWVIKDFLTLGSVVALATLITSILVLFIGKLTDNKNKKKLIRTGSLFYSAIWFVRILAVNGFHILFIDTFSRIFKSTIYMPVVTTTYDQANKSDIIRTVVFFEQSLAFGKIIASLSVYVLLFFFSGWNAAFVIGGLMTLLYVLL
ncbi:MAG: MFS transporter [Patescibacteria group bacterium]